MLVFVIAAFFSDIVLKIVSRSAPAIAGRFSYTSSIGVFGIVPSTNDVLAFSLPISNAWVWPVGWIVVLALIVNFFYKQNSKLEYRNSKQIRIFEIRISKLFLISDFGFRASPRRLAFFAIIFGAISNLFDRTVFGGVTDYLAFSDLYPAFNIADILIIIGIVWWVYAEKTRSA